jgi:carboxyl-terminal processing protease
MRFRVLEKISRALAVLGAFAVAAWLALQLKDGGGLWYGLSPASAAGPAGSQATAPYDLTQLKVVNEVLKTVRDRYVDPKRVKPREMLLSALNYVQRDVAQVIVLHDENAPTVKVRVDTQEREFRVDNVQGPWDVAARLREIFAFVQEGLRGTEVDLREVEYAACNGMLHTLDPHSVLLSPEAYKEMNLSTTGQFGGLGIVISIRDQQLTVINPMPGTPAARAGIRRYDRITKIDNESTLNMGLSEAVNHLRGAPGSKVIVWVHRDGPDGWPGSRPFELVREQIRVQSVEHRLLEGNVGYVRLKQFQANTASDLEAALASMKKQGELRALVLDLRGNPGGLLDQAARVADKFIYTGPIVATVGNPSEGREEKVAHPDGTEPNYPIVLLVSGTSASASEIVAGAMKNHDRAVIVGETTFGKGSVQLVFNDLPDKAALKLTIAQYLTMPGDISIQGVGVTPDIELDPMTVDEKEMDLTVDGGALKERDLSRSLSNARAREGQRPLEVVRYYLAEKERRELRERGGDPDENFQLDFPIRFGRDLAARLPQGKRPEQLRAAKSFINEVRAAELAKVAADLAKIGIDWADAPDGTVPQGTPAVEVKVETDRPGNEVSAGEPMALRVTVTNKGTQPLFRLNAVTKSDNGMYDNKELVFGKLEPGKSKTAVAPLGWCETEGYRPGSTQPLPKDAPRICRIPRDALTRADGIKIHFEEARGWAPPDAEIRVSTKALDRPEFLYSYQVVDNRKGNGDGRLQRDEEVTMYVTIKNVGKGKSYETQANLRNLSGDGLLLRDGRFDVSNMQPGETRRVAFTFDVQPQLQDAEAKVELSITDRDLREAAVEKIRMPIATPSPVAPASGTMKARVATDLFSAADPTARIFGRLPAGAAAAVLGKSGDFVKLSLGQSRFAFARAADLEQGGTAGGAVAFEDRLSQASPSIEIPAPVLATREGKIQLKVSASDETRLLDAYVFVGSRKIFYKSNRNGADPKKMTFDTELPLRPGVNVIGVYARENPDTVARRTFVVRRDGPNGELLATPRGDDDLAENAPGGDD